MKKLINCFLVILLTGTVGMAQTTPSTSSASTPIKVEKNMVIKIPADGDMLYVYEIDAQDLKFKSAADREKYFSGIKDDVVSYRIDRENEKVYLVLDRNYIEEHKWKAADINDHLAKHATTWKEHYDTYNVPDEK